MDVAVVAAAFLLVQAFVTRGVVRGPLPPLEGVLADGTPASAQRWQRERGGEAYLLYVWAGWCAICRSVEGSIDALARSAPVLTVAMRSGGGADVSRLLEARGYRWPTLVDPQGQLAGSLGVEAVPTLLFVGRDGRVRAVTQGYTTELGMRLRLWWAGRSD